MYVTARGRHKNVKRAFRRFIHRNPLFHGRRRGSKRFY